MPIPKLLQQQNPDGGWPYRRGGSWTEPTVYAVLALAGAGDSASGERGLQWIRAAQRDDGGWQARPGIGESCWVTSLAALLPAERLGVERHRRAIAWLSATAGMESTALYRIRRWMMGSQTPSEITAPGWPWVTGSAAWVSPTSLGILALDRENRLRPAHGLESRIDAGRQFLINRMCKGGSIEHGVNRQVEFLTRGGEGPDGIGLLARCEVTLRLFDHLVAASAARYLWTLQQEAGHILGIDAGFDQRWVVDVEVDRPGVGMRR